MARPKLTTPNFKLKPRNGIFQVTFHADGRSQCVSTGTKDRTEALGFLANFAAGYASPAAPATLTVSKVLDGYLADRKPRAASYATLEISCKHLARHLGSLDPNSLTRERARWYAAQRRAEGHMVGPASARVRKPTSDGTIIREMVTLRAALKWAAQEKWIETVPYVPTPTNPPPLDRWLSVDEFDRLLVGAEAAHIKLFIMLALHTGARSQALLDLTWDRVDLDRRRLNLGAGTGNKGRAVLPINDDLLDVLREGRRAATCRSVIEHGGRPVRSIKTGFSAACKRAGLTGVTPHTLRHTAATWMAERGVPMIQISRYMGHTNETITARVYAKHSPEYLQSAANSLMRRRPEASTP